MLIESKNKFDCQKKNFADVTSVLKETSSDEKTGRAFNSEKLLGSSNAL